MTVKAETFLESLIQEVKGTDPEMMPPRGSPKKSKEVHLGYVTDEFTKKVYSLASFYRREGRRLEVDFEAEGINPGEDYVFGQYRQKYDVLMELFWLLIKNETNYWLNGVGVRDGWEVVDTRKADNEAPKIVKKLLGLE